MAIQKLPVRPNLKQISMALWEDNRKVSVLANPPGRAEGFVGRAKLLQRLLAYG